MDIIRMLTAVGHHWWRLTDQSQPMAETKQASEPSLIADFGDHLDRDRVAGENDEFTP